MNESSWLYRWIDEFELTGQSHQLEKLLIDRKSVARLQELAATAPRELPPPYDDVDNALVTGRDMDLSGDLDCCPNTSQKAIIDRNFGRVLHYFDKLIIAGPSAELYSRLLESPNDGVRTRIANQVEGLIYLRKIGANEIVQFQAKVPADYRNYKNLAKNFGIVSALDAGGEILDLLVREGTVVKVWQAGDHWHFYFRHPQITHDLNLALWQKKKPTKKQMARALFKRYACLLTSDVATARMMGLPLGTNADLHASMLAEQKPEPAIGEAALNLYLPVLDGLPIRDIIKLRKDEYDHFAKFQSALRSGLKAQLKESESDPVKAAAEVQKEIIEPALNDINMRLSAAGNSLTKKLSLSLGLGSIFTAVGIIDSIPLVIGSGLTIGAAALEAGQSYVNDRKGVRASDMYFLWLLEKAYRHHGH